MRLSPKERQVLICVANGLKDAEIARELNIGARTARRHIESMYCKVGAINRPNAVYLAWKNGWLT